MGREDPPRPALHTQTPVDKQLSVRRPKWTF